MKKTFLALTLMVALVVSLRATPMGTAFTYQGHLNDGGAPANGTYDFQFNLYSVPSGGSPLTIPTSPNIVAVTNGLFTVTLDFGTDVFNGSARWLDIQTRLSGQNLNFSPLVPRQPVTAAPYSIFAQNAAVASSMPTGMVLQVQALNVGAGHSLMGLYSTITGGLSNSANGSYAIVAGGFNNVAMSNSVAVVGGSSNIAVGNHAVVVGGEMNSAIGDHAFVGGGAYNSASGYDVVSGGFSNRVSADTSGIGSGANNYASGYGSWIGGGQRNESRADFSDISGGSGNIISNNSRYSAIGGGRDNTIEAIEVAGEGYNGIGSGNNNYVSGYGSWIGGGQANQLNADVSNIGGGLANTITNNSFYSTIGGGDTNRIEANSSGATIAGGRGNTIGTNSSFSAICGGEINRIESKVENATIPGGQGAVARSRGQLVYANGYFGPNTYSGDAQTSLYVLRGTTTNSSKTELFLDGNGLLSKSNRMILPLGGAWSFDILIMATVNGNLQVGGFQIKGMIIRNGIGTTIVGNPDVTKLDGSSSWSAFAEEDNAHSALVIRVVGAAGTTIRWVASVRTTEVIF